MGTLAEPKADIVTVEAAAALGRLTDTLKLPPEACRQVVALAAQLLGRLDLPQPLKFGSHAEVGDDGNAYAFSLGFTDDQPEIHLRWEAASSDDFKDRVRAALQMQKRVQEVFGVSGSRFDRVAPLFFDKGGAGASAIVYSARLWPAHKPHEVTAHLNPQALGRLHAPALVEQALELLAFEGAWHSVSAAMSRGAELDEIRSFGLALSADDIAPVEICIRHHDPTPSVVAAAVRVAPAADAERLVDFFQRTTGDQRGAGSEAETRLSFSAAGGAKATTATLRVPMRGRHPSEPAAFVALCAAKANIYALAAKAVGSADAMSLSSPGERSECQLSTETVEATSALMPASPALQTSPVEPMVNEYEAQPLSLHPFFQRMSRQSVDVQHMWLMFNNIYAGLSQHFPRRLARVVFAIEDERIRSILTEQLHEELGSGDYTRTHRRLFVKLLESLAPWKPATVTAEMHVPGARLSERLEAVYFDPQPYAGVGAAIVIELLGKQVDLFVADQFRRQQAVGMASLEWLTLHENLEVDHANESLDLASFVETDDDRAAAWRGGRAVHAAGWLFFDDMYRLCFDA